MIYKFTQIVEEILSTNSTTDEPAAISNVNDPSTSSADPSIADDLIRVEDLSWIEGMSCFDKGAVPQLKMLAAPCCWYLLQHGNRVRHRLENTI